jgi:hypothetical protein
VLVYLAFQCYNGIVQEWVQKVPVPKRLLLPVEDEDNAQAIALSELLKAMGEHPSGTFTEVLSGANHAYATARVASQDVFFQPKVATGLLDIGVLTYALTCPDIIISVWPDQVSAAHMARAYKVAASLIFAIYVYVGKEDQVPEVCLFLITDGLSPLQQKGHGTVALTPRSLLSGILPGHSPSLYRGCARAWALEAFPFVRR